METMQSGIQVSTTDHGGIGWEFMTEWNFYYEDKLWLAVEVRPLHTITRYNYYLYIRNTASHTGGWFALISGVGQGTAIPWDIYTWLHKGNWPVPSDGCWRLDGLFGSLQSFLDAVDQLTEGWNQVSMMLTLAGET